MMQRKPLLLVLCLSCIGCSSVRPVAQHGVDLLENTERSYAVRATAFLGSLVGAAASLPFSVLLFPSYAFDGAWGWGVREPTEADGAGVEGDYAVSLAGVPLEYGIGLGAGIVAAPVAWVEDAIFGEPGPDKGWVEETREPPPGDAFWSDADVEVSDAPDGGANEAEPAASDDAPPAHS